MINDHAGNSLTGQIDLYLGKYIYVVRLSTNVWQCQRVTKYINPTLKNIWRASFIVNLEHDLVPDALLAGNRDHFSWTDQQGLTTRVNWVHRITFNCELISIKQLPSILKSFLYDSQFSEFFWIPNINSKTIDQFRQVRFSHRENLGTAAVW